MEKLKGIIKKINFFNEKNNFYILRVIVNEKEHTVLGVGQNLKINDYIDFEGQFKEIKFKNKIQEQFQATYIKSIKPTSEETILEYLSSGIVKGISKTIAKKMVELWGDQSLEILDTKPTLLSRIKGVGAKKISTIINSWSLVKPQETYLEDLINMGFNSKEAVLIFKRFGEDSLNVINKNPYIVSKYIQQIKFEKIDSIAISLNHIEKTDQRRILATIDYFLQKEHDSTGETLIDYDRIVRKILRYLKIEFQYIFNSIEYGLNNKLFFMFNINEKCYLQRKIVYITELEIAQKLYFLNEGKNFKTMYNKIYELAEIRREGEKKVNFTDEQKEAILICVNNKISILTGKPGTGKTTVLNEIVKQLKHYGRNNILLCAPTGKAAQKMKESTGINSATIHRLLEFNPIKDKFEKNVNSPLDCDVLIIDESSMIDIFLLGNLLRAIGDDTQVIFIGDVNQLPSVSCGAVLRDMINSGCIAVAELNQIHRTSANSDIIKVAHEITETGMFNVYSSKDVKTDMYFIETKNDEHSLHILEYIIKNKIEKEFGFNIYKDVQLLTSMHDGLVGTTFLNKELQKILNQDYDEVNYIKRNGFHYCINDKVIQIKNNYDKEVYNGDTGVIKEIDGQTVTINFDGNDIVYKINDLDEISPAYCLTIHKSQGSEYPVIIIPITENYSELMDRSLIYTGITRGKKMVIILGQRENIKKCCLNQKSRFRKTNLENHIRILFNSIDKTNINIEKDFEKDFVFFD